MKRRSGCIKLQPEQPRFKIKRQQHPTSGNKNRPYTPKPRP